MTLQWPIATLRPRNITRHIAARTTAGTTAASGFTQRVATPAQAWVIKYDGILLATKAQILAWGALAAALDGGANPILVPLVEGDRIVRPTPFDDGTEFGDGTSFDDLGGASGTISGGASAGDTEIDVAMPAGVTIEPGEHFTIGERLYRVVVVVGEVADVWTLNIRPPIREDASGGTVVSWGTLWVKCRLASDDQMMMPLDPAGMGVGTVAFVEDPR
jgi:hypothetical protein